MKVTHNAIRRIVVIRLDGIGDVILTSAFLRELRRHFPQAWICLVVRPEIYNIVECCPHINELLTYDSTSRGYLGRLQGIWRAFRFSQSKLKRLNIDLAILPRWDAGYDHASYIAFFTHATRRVGWKQGSDRLLTDAITNAEPKHEVERNLDIVRFLGGTIESEEIEVWLRPEDELFARRRLQSENVGSDELLIAFGVGGRHPKRWPVANSSDLGKWIVENYESRIIVLGDGNDVALGRELRDHVGDAVIDLTGRSTLRETAATLKRCSLYVGNDTGAAQIAAAAGVPAVVVSCHHTAGSPTHPNSPLRFGPWHVKNAVVQPAKPLSPCNVSCVASDAHCIRQVQMNDVKNAVAQCLQ